MEAKPGVRPYLILLFLFGCAGALLAFTVDVRVSDEAGVKPSLPVALGDDWTGYDVLFCQEADCGRSWLAKDLEPNADGEFRCPQNWRGEACGGALDAMARGEKMILPGDTVIFKKQYFHNRDPEDSVYAAVVLSGKDRSSIHRPEVCMAGQGNTIEKSEVIEVPLPGREPLQVMVLNLSRKAGPHTRHSYYAYWFVGKDRETALHWERVLWMGLDRILRNVSHRWAYISVSGERGMDPTDTAHHAEIRKVVGDLYPQLVLADPGA